STTGLDLNTMYGMSFDNVGTGHIREIHVNLGPNNSGLKRLGVYEEIAGELELILYYLFTPDEGWNSFYNLTDDFPITSDRFWIFAEYNEVKFALDGDKQVFEFPEAEWANPGNPTALDTAVHNVWVKMECDQGNCQAVCGEGTVWDPITETCIDDYAGDQFCNTGVVAAQGGVNEITADVGVSYKISVDQNVVMDNIGIFLEPPFQFGVGKFAVYSDNAGVLGSPLWESSAYSAQPGDLRVSVPDLNLIPGDYHLAFVSNADFWLNTEDVESTNSFVIVQNFNDPWNDDPFILPYVNRDASLYATFVCDTEEGPSLCGPGTVWNSTLQKCEPVSSCVGDLNGDSTVNTSDILILLSTFGTDC
ncbi:MAG: hypothetical protein HKN32_07840, partial [Flavobacteriales bacterium]|nr:hypothetical protein [Flavobacteriales bacterium]